MAHAQKPYFVFWRNGRVHLNRRSCQFSRLLAAEVCATAVVMVDTPCSEVVWRVLATHSILQFPLQFPSRASPCAITFQLGSIHCAGGWVGPRAGLTDAENVAPHQDSISGPPSPWVAIPIELSWPIYWPIETMISYTVGETSVKDLPTFQKNLLPPFSGYCKNRGCTFRPKYCRNCIVSSHGRWIR
jgi:hypothetical protein